MDPGLGCPKKHADPADPDLQHIAPLTTEYIFWLEKNSGYCVCPLSWSVHCNFTGYGSCNERGWGVHPPPSPARANFTLMIECTPESSSHYSVYSVPLTNLGEGVEEVPEEGKHGGGDGYGADEKAAVHEAMVLQVGQPHRHHLTHSVVQRVLHRHPVPLEHLHTVQ